MRSIAILISVLAVANCASVEYNPLIQGRIIGGYDVEIDKAPYQVSVEYYGSHICGGAIISETSVVTAAHCTYGLSPSAVSIRAGSSTLGAGGSVRQVNKIIPHELFLLSSLDFDISVLKFESPLIFGTTINRASLAMSLPSGGLNVVASGWGATSKGGPSASKLQAVDLKIVDRDSCKLQYPPEAVTNRMICASGASKDLSESDSGGPLIVKGTNILEGIISWGFNSADSGKPGVYVSIPNLWSWLLPYL